MTETWKPTTIIMKLKIVFFSVSFIDLNRMLLHELVFWFCFLQGYPESNHSHHSGYFHNNRYRFRNILGSKVALMLLPWSTIAHVGFFVVESIGTPTEIFLCSSCCCVLEIVFIRFQIWSSLRVDLHTFLLISIHNSSKGPCAVK